MMDFGNAVKQSLVPARWKVLSGSALKLIAMFTMVVDHCGVYLFKSSNIVLFTLFDYSYYLYDCMRIVGRIAFPLFAFLLVEGFLHTRSRKNYLIRLVVFAVISEIPWNLIHGGTLILPEKQNVFFTLALGLAGLCVLEKFADDKKRLAIGLLSLAAASVLLNSDYGIAGFSFVLALYALREMPLVRAVVGAGMLPMRPWPAMAFIPIAFYNGKRGFIHGRVLQYAFYAIYPVHLFILWAVTTF